MGCQGQEDWRNAVGPGSGRLSHTPHEGPRQRPGLPPRPFGTDPLGARSRVDDPHTSCRWTTTSVQATARSRSPIRARRDRRT
jgi:hypothetical protein